MVKYTYTGNCNEATPNPEIRSYEGFDYLAYRLASWGHIVVSINANRGISGYVEPRLNLYPPFSPPPQDDGAMIRARGRLVLKHLAQWQEWNASGGEPQPPNFNPYLFWGQVDMSQIGLMGHRAAAKGCAQLTIWPMNFQVVYQSHLRDRSSDLGYNVGPATIHPDAYGRSGTLLPM
jgi:hypothetical protein